MWKKITFGGAAAGAALLAVALVIGLTGAGVSAAPLHPPAAAPVVSPAVDVTPPASPPSAGRAMAEELSRAFEQAADLVSPSVVPVFAEKQVPGVITLGGPGLPFGDDLLRRFFGDRLPEQGQQQTIRGVGSGVIVTEDGTILTNNHVVDGAQRLYVLINDERYEAKVVGTDPATDLAVIKVDAHGLPAAKLGESADLRVGQWVIAVGNPYELLHTVTAGIVSAQGRASVGLAEYEDFIQTDASINPGNSGGALADLDGRVIGINTAISSPTGASVGIGFAIPIDMAKRVMADLTDHGKVVRGYLALVPQDLDATLADALGIPSRQGALVAQVEEGGPADEAGIERGDVIVDFAGKPVANSLDLRNQVAAAEPGKKVPVEILRNGKERKLDVELGERPAPGHPGESAQGFAEPSLHQLGLTLRTLTSELARQVGSKLTSGALVVDVEPGGVADQAGLQSGDVITRVGDREITDAASLQHALEHTRSGDKVALVVSRGEATFFVGIEMP